MISYDSEKLKKRLDMIWKEPNFESFFQKYSTRPPLKIKREQTIFFEGDQPDKIYYIKKGFVKLHHSSLEGKDTIVYLYGPGSILGLRALTTEDKILRHNAEALTDVEVITMGREEYLKLLTSHPEYVIDLLHAFIQRLNYTEKKLEGFILTDATSRVAFFLNDTAKRFGQKSKEGIVIPFPLTHQRISEFVGSFRETITNAVNKLESEEIIKSQKGTISILNLKKLQKYASYS